MVVEPVTVLPRLRVMVVQAPPTLTRADLGAAESHQLAQTSTLEDCRG